jgi:hypothetical protein
MKMYVKKKEKNKRTRIRNNKTKKRTRIRNNKTKKRIRNEKQHNPKQPPTNTTETNPKWWSYIFNSRKRIYECKSKCV